MAFLSVFLPLLISWIAGGWVARFYSPPFSPTDIPDLTGKTAIVTGANTGIGYSTARELARKGAKVVIGCRSDERGRDAVARIKQELSGAVHIEYINLDLSSFKSVKTFVSSFRSKFYSMDILILNAAVIMNSYDETENGFEAQIGTNHLGHFLLVKLLLPMIRYSKTRVIHISSASHMDSYPEGTMFVVPLKSNPTLSSINHSFSCFPLRFPLYKVFVFHHGEAVRIRIVDFTPTVNQS